MPGKGMSGKKRARLLIGTCLRSLEEAAVLIDKDPRIIHERTGLGETALHYLAVENHLEAVRFLHQRGSNINTINNLGETPIYQVSSLCDVELAEYLLENGASIDLKGSAQELDEYGEMDPIIIHAVMGGNPAMIELLIKYGADINARNSLQETALHKSASHDEFIKVTHYLVEKGVDINSIDVFHVTPLIDAAMFGCMETAKYLVQSGASLTIEDDQGRTAAKMAQECGFPELAKWLEWEEYMQNRGMPS